MICSSGNWRTLSAIAFCSSVRSSGSVATAMCRCLLLGFRAAIKATPGPTLPRPMPVTAADGNAAIQGYFPGDLGVELVAVDTEEVRGRLAVDQRHLHPGHLVHGGVWVA